MKYTIQASDVGKDINELLKAIKKKPKFDAEHIELPMNVSETLWISWCMYRKEKKKAVSRMAAERQIKLLSKYTVVEQEQIIDNSITNDYQGLFDLKGSKSNGQSYTDSRRQFFDNLTGEQKPEGSGGRSEIIGIHN